MGEKIENIINTSLNILEIHTNELLKKSNENIKDFIEMDNNLHILIEIGCALQKLQRIKLDQLQGYKGV